MNKTIHFFSAEGTGNDLLRSEKGGMSFSALIVVIGLGVVIGLVGNMGTEVLQKQRLQNAADAGAYSTAVWMARGMNTVSAINHVMGELTANIVILDALFGDGVKPYKNGSTKTESNLNDGIKGASSTAKSDLLQDGFLIDILLELLLPDRKTGIGNKHYSGGAVYDGICYLKLQTWNCLIIKDLLYAGELIAKKAMAFPPAGVALTTLVIAGTLIFDIVVLPELIVNAAAIGLLDQLPRLGLDQVKTISREFLFGLSRLSDMIAGGNVSGFSVSKSIAAGLTDLETVYGVSFVVYPGSDDLRLPLRQEPFEEESKKDKNKKTGSAKTESAYCLGKLPWKDADKPSGAVAKISEISADLQRFAKNFEYLSWIAKAGRIIMDFVIIPIIEKLGIKEATKAVEAIRDIFGFIEQIFGMKQHKPDLEGYKDNPSKTIMDETKFDLVREGETQWVRATYPYVDSIRGPIRKWFQGYAFRSTNISTYFTKWCYRYTLEESYRIRSGKNMTDKAYMYLMDDPDPEAEDQKKKEVKKIVKGEEKWFSDAELAESMFTVICAAQKPAEEPLFIPAWFKRGREDRIAVSQAMFYNANGRDPSKNKPQFQQNNGWDTLQWAVDPGQGAIRAPEWSNGDPSLGPSSQSPDKFLTGKHEYGPCDVAETKLNWQAKLVPIGPERWAALAEELDDVDEDQAKKLAPLFTH